MGRIDPPYGDGYRGLTMLSPAEPDMYSAEEFWDILQKHGMELGHYTADGLSRLGKKANGQWSVLSVHDSYPGYIIDRILREAGYLPPPTYEHLN